MSGAIGPSVRMPLRPILNILSGWRIESVAAVPSKPQWTMQFEHFSYLPTPYWSQSVPSISSANVGT